MGLALCRLGSTLSQVYLCLFAGAGAAAAANDAAGYFKFELLRRLVLEFAVPWVSLAVSARRKASGASGPTSQGSSGLSPSLQQAARDALRLGFDPFTGVWDVTRDIG